MAFDKMQAEKALKDGRGEAENLLHDADRMERFLQRLEKKLKVVPLAGEELSEIPLMASLLRSYVKKEYTDVPLGTILAVISALLYFVSPVDLIPDAIPGAGYLDDAAVAMACWKLIESDAKEYMKWRTKNYKDLDI